LESDFEESLVGDDHHVHEIIITNLSLLEGVIWEDIDVGSTNAMKSSKMHIVISKARDSMLMDHESARNGCAPSRETQPKGTGDYKCGLGTFYFAIDKTETSIAYSTIIVRKIFQEA
jgi:hypothetical protein